MSALRRALPFLVAATTGVVSGIYIFKPAFESDTTPSTPNIPASESDQKSTNLPSNKDTTR
ncbi:hypothetical protein BJ165DRAFT_1429287 [Panaeolus papilionaceus]|nr:hypothetical protein BJ165DRAFT_1429287 [Panaeolus papilionaceus]